MFSWRPKFKITPVKNSSAVMIKVQIPIWIHNGGGDWNFSFISPHNIKHIPPKMPIDQWVYPRKSISISQYAKAPNKKRNTYFDPVFISKPLFCFLLVWQIYFFSCLPFFVKTVSITYMTVSTVTQFSCSFRVKNRKE